MLNESFRPELLTHTDTSVRTRHKKEIRHPWLRRAKVERWKRLSGWAACPLAQRLGDTAHVSPLLRRICRISGCEEDRAGDWLLKCAITAGVPPITNVNFPKIFLPIVLN